MRILGLDLSLASTGYCLLDTALTDEPWPGRPFVTGVVWYGSVAPKSKEVSRLAIFNDWIHGALAEHQPTHVGIEGYSYGSPQGATHAFAIGELGGIIKLAIHQAGAELHVIPPSTWKKQLLGKGNLAKDQVRLEAWKRYGVEFASQDTLDAWAVAECCRRQLLGLEKPEPKVRKRASAGLPLLASISAGNSGA